MNYQETEAKHRFYSDALSNYIVLQCPQDVQGDYQYRMLAVNRIPGLLPCSIRVIDGESFLYYSITSRQSIARRYEQHLMDGEELKIFLYAAASMIQTLSEFLLDATCLLMDPEYIFYDYEQEKYCFTYYPGVQQEGHQTALFEYLAERIDPDDEISRIVTFRLCELSENTGFILKTELLDHEYAMARGPEIPEKRENEVAGEGETAEFENEWRNPRDSMNTSRYDRQRWETEDEIDIKKADASGRTNRKLEQRKKGKKGVRDKEEASPMKMLLVTILFGAAAAGFLITGLRLQLSEEELFAVRAGMFFCLGMTMFSAIYGLIRTWKHGKKQAQKEEEDKEERRRNAMTQSEGVL